MQPLHLIYARAANGVIGGGQHHALAPAEDMAHFKQLTQGCAVIMGRKTWDSLPHVFGHCRGAPTSWSPAKVTGRPKVRCALTAWKAPDPGPRSHHRAPPPGVGDGRSQIYAQALPLASRVEVTEIAQDFDGDAYAPHWALSGRKPRAVRMSPPTACPLTL